MFLSLSLSLSFMSKSYPRKHPTVVRTRALALSHPSSVLSSEKPSPWAALILSFSHFLIFPLSATPTRRPLSRRTNGSRRLNTASSQTAGRLFNLRLPPYCGDLCLSLFINHSPAQQTMSFSDFTKIETVTKLNEYLKDKSYIEGTAATQADVAAYKAFQTAYPAFARWFNHIASFSEEFETLPAASAPAAAAEEEEEDDDEVDLFGSDDEVDAEAEKLKAERVAAYNERKAAKGPKAAAKSIVTIDVKPWDDETDLEAMLAHVKSIEIDGLVWGGHSFIPVGFGIKKLQINCVIEDTVSMDDLALRIEEDGEEWVQSMDVAAMQKL